MSLAQAGFVGAQDHRQVTELRRLPSEGLVNMNLLRRIVDVIVAPYDVCYLHVYIIDDNNEIVSRCSVRAENDHVVEQVVLEYDGTLDHVVEHGRAFLRHLESYGERLVRHGLCYASAPAIIFRCPSLGKGLLSSVFQFLGGTIAAICLSLGKQTIHIVPVDIESVGLSKWPFVPVEIEPLHPFDDRLDIVVG